MFLNRPLEGDRPFLWLDSICVKLREGGQIVSMAVIVAVTVNTPSRQIALQSPAGQWTAAARSSVSRSCRPKPELSGPAFCDLSRVVGCAACGC
ncbi:transposase [uncultured Jannaschia sp.]|uniref:transposase n=1 Tax=uncultured Jannaschia sp. TaxID=293347 RepID=UPI00345BA5BE